MKITRHHAAEIWISCVPEEGVPIMQLGHKFHGGQIELVAVVAGQNRPEIALVGDIEAGIGFFFGGEEVQLHQGVDL
ncbi:MAG: hypothetical protein ABSB39_22990 [Candidatus Sulfotelmatobacter sp.]